MLTNYLRLTFRTFLKNKVAFLINLLGMSIALGLCIAAYINYGHNAGFDQQQLNADQLYRIGFFHQTEKGRVPYGVCPIPAGNIVREHLKDGDELIQYISKTAQFRIKDEMFQKEFIYADPAFTRIFTMELLSGSLSLTDKSQVLISDELARTYYNATEVVGKPLTQIISGEPREFVIGGVYKAFPFNSSFRFDLLTTYDNYFSDPLKKSEMESDWSRWTTSFLFLRNPDAAAPITTQLQQYVKPQNEARPDLKVSEFYIEPFNGMPMRALKGRNQGHWLNMPMPPAAVLAPFVMAGFLLLVACFNFMNNAIAVSANRLKEIGIRKVIGGKRKELVLQFLSETLVFCFLALLIALVLAEYFVAGWNYMWPSLELTISYSDNIRFFVMLLTLVVFTALLAGGYPALYVSAFRPIQILRGTTRFGGNTALTKSLLVFQFSISLAAVIFAIAFYFNSKFQKEFDLGYSYRSVIQVPLDNPQQFDQLKNVLVANPLITSVGGTQHHIYSNSYKAGAKAENQQEKEIDVLNIGDDYFETVHVRMVQGSKFETDKVSDVNESLIVNEEFVRAFNLGPDPIGKRITLNDTVQVYISGVVKDVYLRALFQPLAPVGFRYVPVANYKYLVAATRPAHLVEVNEQIKGEWKKLFPNQLYTGRLMEQNMVMALEHFDNVVILYTFLGLVAIIMSVSGLYSLVSLNLQKRTKELGIRKILGAPIPHIVLQASKLFLIIMLISFCLGTLLGAVMVNGMMNSVWEYYEAVNFKVVSLAILALMSIALTTIFLKIVRVTMKNPVDSLRYE